MAWSNKTGIEMFRYGDHIMGIQGHPEYTKDILLHLIDRLLQHNLIEVNLRAELQFCLQNDFHLQHNKLSFRLFKIHVIILYTLSS